VSATTPKGVSGVSAPSGYVQQRENNPSLRWPFDVGTAVEPGAYERMSRTDATVASCVMAVVLPIAQADWSICEPEKPPKLKDPNADPEDDQEGAEPPGETGDPEDVAEPPEPTGDAAKDPGTGAPAGAEDMATPGGAPDPAAEGDAPPDEEAVDPITAFVRQAFLEDLRPGLPKSITDIVRSAVVNGHHVVEPLFRLLEDGEFAGNVTLRTLAPRPAWTIERFNLDDAGELVSVVQGAPEPAGMWARPELSVEEILVFTYDQQGGDPRGQSMLRPIFMAQKVKELLLKLIGVRNEREALGMPMAEVPLGFPAPELAKLKASLRGYRAHEEGFIIFPTGVKVTVPEGKSGAATSIRDDFNALDVQISRAFVQQFQHLGTSDTGSRSVGEVHADLFYLVLTALAGLVVDQLNLLIERLVDLNYGPQERYPYFEAPKIRPEDVAKALEPIATALKDGLITHDDSVEKAARDMLGLPQAKPKPALHPAMQAVADAAAAGQIAPPAPPPSAAAPAAAAIAKAAQAAAMTEPRPKQAELFLGGFTPRRMLSAAEKRVAFGEMVARFDNAAPELQQRVGNAIRGNRQDLVAWLRPLARRLAAGDQGALVDLARKDLPRAVRAEIVAAVNAYANDLHRFGRAQAERERKLSPSVARRAARAAAELVREDITAAPEPSAVPPALVMDDLAKPEVRAEASIAADRIADELLRVLRLAVTRAAEQKRPLPDILDELERAVDASAESMAVVRDAAMATSVKAVSGGREEVFAENADEIASVSYSAAMDSNTCGVCEAADGREEPSLAEADASLPATPNPECLGGAERCRCIWVVDYR
jgi:hypothetical protein